MKNKIPNYPTILLSTLPVYLPPPSTNYRSEPTTQQKISDIEKLVQPTSSRNLPQGVSGLANPGTQSGEGMRAFFASDNQSHYARFVEIHEGVYGHLGGIDGSPRGEYLADAIAAERTGRPELIRGPFYQPPINLR